MSERSASIQAPTRFGVSGGSDQSLTSASSGTFTSRDGSSLSSGWSVGRFAGSHMPMAMMAQGGGVPTGDGMAMCIKREVVPLAPTPVDQDDVVIGEQSLEATRVDMATVEDLRPEALTARTIAVTIGVPEVDTREGRTDTLSGRSGRSARSLRSESSVGSRSSGATQIALNTMRQVQDAVSRMENTQGSTLEKLGLALKAELGRMVSSHDDSQARRGAETLEALRVEAARLERERSEALLGHYQAHLEARQAEEADRTAAMMAVVQQDLHDLRMDRDQERLKAKILQKYLVGQLRNLQTTSAQDQGSAGKIHRESSGVINERTSAGRMGQDMKNTDEFLASKLQETLNAAKAVSFLKPAAAQAQKVVASKVKAEPVFESKPPAPTRSTSGRVSGWSSSGTSMSPEPHRRESSRKRKTGKSRRHGDPSDSDPNSDSSSKSDSSNSSDSSSFGDTTPGVTMKTAEGGTTVYTFKPFVNSNTLEDLDPKASLATRIRWLERFQIKVYEMKLKMPAPVRNWRANLELKVCRDWKRFLKAFRERYCKANTSDSERYYTMIQKKYETPLEFYYRLNKVAEKAGLDFKSSSKARKRHLKVFMKKLLDTRLRSTLQGQRIRSLKDVEDHLFDGMKRVAMVDGAVNGRRTGILLDPGTSASVVSLNLARGLKLKLRFSKPFRGAGDTSDGTDDPETHQPLTNKRDDIREEHSETDQFSSGEVYPDGDEFFDSICLDEVDWGDGLPHEDRDLSEAANTDALGIPNDQCKADFEGDAYVVEAILDLRWSQDSCTPCRSREYLVKLKRCTKAMWFPESHRDRELLCDFDRVNNTGCPVH
ncbi:hypothetical protein PHYSODRAFT_335756 [Phytophthora sojae]|uniref:Retrotransposon gag domain-containing protein n=1 Tax=Phytophthora sojae (strain P6497) TaxID=1094619 RepID=G4ZQZ8_PHYSP|nr:hypothetical protein PHYSODRAFT_335756 [Phytophthora sojae]EGZ14078.1 hypothetical protein PHYSODRAFT_335756 [Phytophthora sojae]|eukprot:XP_009531507.1 hypothetical protein PHYSODRAFT_335756 [Phytophthora sojae]